MATDSTAYFTWKHTIIFTIIMVGKIKPSISINTETFTLHPFCHTTYMLRLFTLYNIVNNSTSVYT